MASIHILLRPANWYGLEQAVHRALVPGEGVPKVVLGRDEGDAWAYLNQNHADAKGGFDLLELEARGEMAAAPGTWEVFRTTHGGKPHVLALSPEPEGSARLLDPETLNLASAILETRNLYVACPEAGSLFACAAQGSMASRFTAWAEQRFATAEAPLSDRVFIVEAGELVGVAPKRGVVAQRTAKPVDDRPQSYQLSSVMMLVSSLAGIALSLINSMIFVMSCYLSCCAPFFLVALPVYVWEAFVAYRMSQGEREPQAFAANAASLIVSVLTMNFLSLVMEIVAYTQLQTRESRMFIAGREPEED